MGVDAIIMFRSLDGNVPTECSLPNHWRYEPTEIAHDIYEAAMLERHYGPGYERGCWQRISPVLMGLLASPNVADVSYDTDSNFDRSNRTIIDADWVAERNRYFMEHGHRGYFDKPYCEGLLPTATQENDE